MYVGVTLTALKTSSVDIMVQKFVEGKEKVDWRRNATFLAFGITYQGAWQYYLFNRVMPRMIPDAYAFAAKSIREKVKDVRGIRNVMIQNFVENGLNNPLLFFPTFYTIKELISGGKSVYQAFSRGVGLYRKNFWSDITACWTVWVPAQTINFAFSPAWFRVPFVALVSAGWTGYVSMTRGSSSLKASCDDATDSACDEDSLPPLITMPEAGIRHMLKLVADKRDLDTSGVDEYTPCTNFDEERR